MDLEVARADRRLDAVAVAPGLRERTCHGRLADAVEAEHPPAGRRRAREHGLHGLAGDGRRPEPAQLAGRAGHHDVDAALTRDDEPGSGARDPDDDGSLGHRRLLRHPGREVAVRPAEPFRDPARDPLDRALELRIDAERGSGDPCDELDGAVVVRRAEPAGDEADVGVLRGTKRRLEVVRVVPDDHDPLRHETERERLAGVERAVPIGALAAHELAARDDDDRARPRAHPLTAVAPDTVSARPPGGNTYRAPFTFTTTLRGRSTESDSDFFVNRWVCPFSSVPV